MKITVIGYSRWILPVLCWMMAVSAQATEVQTVEVAGKEVAWLVQDEQLPVLSLRMVFTGCGAISDPKGKEGLASFTTALLDQGAGEMTAASFQQALDDRAIRLSFSSGADDAVIYLKTTRAEMEEAFRLLTLALTTPRFEAEDAERIRGQMQAMLARNQQSPGWLAGRQWEETAYPNHAYGRPSGGTEESIHRLQAADAAQFAGSCFARDNLLVALAGAIGPKEAAGLLKPLLDALPAQAALPEVAWAAPSMPAEPVRVSHVGPQTAVLFGSPGIARDDPDFYAAYLLNHAIGGNGLISRLGNTIRRERGLVYGVGSWLQPQEHSAVWMGSMATRNENVGEAVQLLREVLTEIGEQGISEEELEQAKRYITGSFALGLDTNDKLVSYLLLMQQEKLGRDYLEKRNGLMEAVTHAQVQRVAKRLFDPLQLLVVMVGNGGGE